MLWLRDGILLLWQAVPKKVTSLLVTALFLPIPKTCSRTGKVQKKANKDEQSSGTDSLKVFLHLQFSQAVTPQMLLQLMSWNEESRALTTKVSLTCAHRDQLGCCVQTLPDGSTEVASSHTWREETCWHGWFYTLSQCVQNIESNSGWI